MKPTRDTQAADDQPLFGLEDRPGFVTAALAGLQHLLAGFVNIIAPAIVVGGVLGLNPYVPYLISASLLVSGIATWIQSQRLGSIGSGLLSIQGTSFAFVAALITAGQIARDRGAGDEEVLAILFGVSLFASGIEIAIALLLPKLKRVMTKPVAGTVVLLIGLSLVTVAVKDMGGGAGSASFGSGLNVALSAIVIGVVLFCQVSRFALLRIGSVLIGLLVGCVAAGAAGALSPPDLSNVAWLSVPIPFRFGFAFDWVSFIPIAFMFVITSLETVGDITGTSRVSGEPVEGPLYERRVRGGVLADGINSALAAVLTTFPNTTFSQNTGVVQLTGVASRYVGRFVAGILVLLGLVPALGVVLQQIPRPVLGGTTFVMFSLIAVSGIQILGSQKLSRRQVLTVALALGAGMGVQLVPGVLSFLPPLWQKVFGSGITTGGLVAILGGLLIPLDAPSTAESEVTEHAAVPAE